MGIEGLVAGVLAVWRITHLLALEDGPFDAVLRLRRALGDGTLGHLMDCFYCLSVWVGLAVAVGIDALGATHSAGATLLMWPALSGGALLLQRATQHADAALPMSTRPQHRMHHRVQHRMHHRAQLRMQRTARRP